MTELILLRHGHCPGQSKTAIEPARLVNQLGHCILDGQEFPDRIHQSIHAVDFHADGARRFLAPGARFGRSPMPKISEEQRAAARQRLIDATVAVPSKVPVALFTRTVAPASPVPVSARPSGLRLVIAGGAGAVKSGAVTGAAIDELPAASRWTIDKASPLSCG